ncbi:carotenoid ester lipase precursor [Lactarius psammicola]|nr:carotenoid ester lipase precursor [Lactarius psammicola]
MAPLQTLLVIICTVTATVLASPTIRSTSPIVTLDRGKFIGTTSDGVDKFLGIPFAQPPVGDLRLRLPQALGPYSGTHNATAFGLSCPQQATTQTIPNGLPQEAADYVASAFPTITLDSEDCLTLNVIAPAYARHGSKLPVVVWIHGGGFSTGSSSLPMYDQISFFIIRSREVKEMHSYDGGVIVKHSIALKEPVVYVSLNYRLAAFGFLASQEVKDAGVGNLGLHDQRMALRWIQKYIYAFGGDSSKVTIWGQSSGSVSVSLQMLTNGGNTEGLFRAAFMQSGSPPPIGDITHGQRFYDDLVERTGCSGSSDTLACLRAAPYEKLKAAMDNSQLIAKYNPLVLVWQVRADGVFLEDDPQKLVQHGKVASVPFVTGDCDDEGTLSALLQLNVTTDSDLRNFLSGFFLPSATDAELDELLRLYPQNVTQGSPYDTGTQNAFAPQFKRIASILGDSVFQALRRFFLNNVSEKQNTWSFCTSRMFPPPPPLTRAVSKRLKSLPVLGSAHGTDILNIYGAGELADYLIHFATNLDPNGGSSPQWPQYTTSSPQLMTLLDSQVTNITTTLDVYRVDGIDFLTELWLAHPL